jgi:hypothetical protein
MDNSTSAASEANNAIPSFGEDQVFTGHPEADLNLPGELVTITDVPAGVSAPVVVAGSVESALALAAAGLLPGPARILATLSVEGLSALRLPKQPISGGGSPCQFPGRVVFAPDGRMAVVRAAQYAARRAAADGWSVDLLPAPKGTGWTDVLLGRAKCPEEDLARIRSLWDPCPEPDLRDATIEPAYDNGDAPA